MVADAGKQLYHYAVRAGFGKETYLHAAGDGATWIADQIDEQFGTQGPLPLAKRTGPERAGQRVAAIQTLVETVKLNDFNPANWLKETLE